MHLVCNVKITHFCVMWFDCSRVEDNTSSFGEFAEHRNSFFDWVMTILASAISMQSTFRKYYIPTRFEASVML